MAASLSWCHGVTPGWGGYQSPLFTPEERISVEPEQIETPDVPFEEIDGHECLVAPAAIRPSEAARLVLLADKADGNEAQMFVDLLDTVEQKYVADEARYQQVFVDRGMSGVTELVMAWMGEFVASKH